MSASSGDLQNQGYQRNPHANKSGSSVKIANPSEHEQIQHTNNIQAEHNHQPPSNAPGEENSHKKNDYQSPNYLDWASNLLLDQNNDFLDSFDFEHGSNQMAHKGYANATGSREKTQPLPSLNSPNEPQANSAPPNEYPQSSSSDQQKQTQPSQSQSQHSQSQPSHPQPTQSQQTHAQQAQHLPNHQLQQPQQAQQAQAQTRNLQPQQNATQPAQSHSAPPGVQPSAQIQYTDPRSKSRRPCDHCRRRKTRCVIVPGAQNCVQCEAKSLSCTYLPSKPEDEPATKRLRKQASPLSENGYRPQMDIVPPNVPIRDVPPVQDYSVMNNSLLKKTLSLQYPRSSFYVGPTSYLFDWNLLDAIIDAQNRSQPNGSYRANGKSTCNKIEQINLSDSISLRKVGERTQFVLKDDQSKQSYSTMSNDVDAIEKFVAPHGQILIDLYFRIIHPSYPILHKKVFLEKYSRTHREFSAPLLAAVYVLAIQWWDYDPQLNRFPKPNVRLILKIALNNYVSEILKRPKLSAVQAGLLLLQCKHILREFGQHDPSNTEISASASLSSSFTDCGYNDWVLCSQIVALSEELGLGLDCDHWKLPKWERGLRKRLSWAVYMEHKWLALKNARPSHIDANNWEVSQLIEEDFPEKHGDGDLKEGSSDITNGKKNFMNLILLSQILSDILTSLYSMKAMREVTDINDVLRIAKPIQLRLKTWYHSLPVELQMNSVQPRKLCSNGYLQLAYFATELTLHRKIITVLHQLSLSGKEAPKELIDVCRAAAKTRLSASIEFVRDLKPEHIHSFWHSSSAENFTLIGTFAALLFISSTTKQESEYYKDQIFNYRWILKISSKGFVQVGDALQKLDLVLNHVPGLLIENAEQPMVVPNVPTIDYSKLYQQQQMSQSSPMSVSSADTATYPQNQAPRPFQNRFNSYGPANTQFMNAGGVSPRYGTNNKNPDMTRPSSAQQYRMSTQNHSPYSSPQTFNPSGFQQPPPSRMNQVGVNSPQSSQGLSPKEIIRQQKLVHANEASGEGTDRRASSASRGSDIMSGKDNHSSNSSSPLMIRSPLAQQQRPSVQNGNSDA
ncbi:putative transcriptional activator protein [Clavispora lusitaniae]|uniref:Transcriptional activator protein n=1 Tax=Clavispora lusitaniae TaxID=36911 RepID=A0AA91PYU5_CLALS|nr:putative transcriptional activator protein [Clavispora lusitaniae]